MDSDSRPRSSLRKKLIFALVIIALLPGVFGVSAIYITSRYMFLNSVGKSFSEMARQKAETVKSLLTVEVQRVESTAQSPDIVAAVIDSNKKYQKKSSSEIQAELKRLNDKYEKSGVNDPIVKQFTQNYLAGRMASIRKPNPEKYLSICVWDKYGSLVGCSNEKGVMLVSNYLWFKRTISEKEHSAYITGINKKGSSKPAFSISVPIHDHNNTSIGVVKAVFDPVTLFSPAIGTEFGETGHFNLVDSQGNLLLDPLYKPYKLKFPASLMKKMSLASDGFIVGSDEHDELALMGISRVGKIPGIIKGSLDGKEWLISVRQRTAEAVSPTNIILTAAILPGIFTLAVLALIAAAAISRLINPLERLKKGALMIGNGNFDYRINLSTQDEIEELGEAFNSMAKNLKVSEDKLRSQADKLRTINEQLENANKLKTEFLANMSHELRTPLNSIIGFAEVLNDKIFGELNEKQLKYINNIHTSGKHLLALINDILDLSKVEAGKMDLSLEKFSISRALSDVETIIWPLANKKKLNLSVQKDESLAEITADLGKFKQIMYNLLSNAVKFTPESGSVSVTSDIREGFLEINVIDSGIGIKPEYVDLIFEEFRQIDDSLSRQYEGTGLGLALTKKLVELHGGRLWVNSQMERGSTFTFIIPIDGSSVSANYIVPVQPSAMETVDISKLTQPSKQPSSDKELVSLKRDEEIRPLILVVEDDLKSSELMQVYLTQAGYEVDYAYDGLQALEKAERLRPMAIILDIMLPKMDGWTVLQELRTKEATADIPVIIVSMIDNSELGFALGAIDYIVKPVDKHTLIDHLKKHSFTTKVKLSPFSVLVVDDDPNSVELLSAILEPEGFGVLKAYGGEEAIKISKEAVPDLIILDLMMPNINGFEVIAELRQDMRTKNIPIIVFTAKQLTKEDIARMNSHILKTIKKAELSKEDLLEEIYKVEQSKPEHANLIDGLTGLFNRRYFLKRLSREIKDAELVKRTFALLMIDIGDFKKLNETYGHEFGDKILKDFSKILISSLRKNDLTVRLESDNFAVILPETTKESAVRVSEKLLRNIKSLNIDDKSSLSIAIGIANYFQDANDKEQLIEKALENLRTAMISGKNKIYPEKVKT